MKISILGTGVFGIALLTAINQDENEITLWTKFQEEKDYILNNHVIKNMPNIKISENVKVTNDLNKATNDSDLIIIVIPSNFVGDLIKNIKDNIKNKHICIASKGLDIETNDFMSKTCFLNSINNVCVLAGPTFANDLANHAKTGITLASNNNETLNKFYKVFKNEDLKIELTNDVIGVELSGTIKNIFAIISGMMDGLNYTTSTKSFVMSELINELNNIIIKFNGNKNTILSLASLGDILLTCGSHESRNYTLGKLIATKNQDTVDNYLKKNTVEGYDNLDIMINLLKKYEIESKALTLIYKTIKKEITFDDFLNYLIIK